MSQTYTGEVRDGVIVFDQPAPALPVGTRVQIRIVEPVQDDSDGGPTLFDRLKPVIGQAEGLPPDMAEQHDHYLHGTPKR